MVEETEPRGIEGILKFDGGTRCGANEVECSGGRGLGHLKNEALLNL